MATKFFEERTDQSEVKARIVQKYFEVWAKVIAPSAKRYGNKIAYIDLYAGPGRYKDGAMSTPLLILQKAIADPQLREMLVSIFNDGNGELVNTLTSEIGNLTDVDKLKHQPFVNCSQVDDQMADLLSKTKLVPTFSFVDPFGYKGISLKIVNGVIKDWGCDCVFFFNYNRVNAGISNPAVEPHMDALFGTDRANELRKSLAGKDPADREALILEALANAIKAMGGKFVLPFKFKNSNGRRTSHSLIFVSKHFKGYEIMKDIMAAESSTLDQGVPSLEYSPATAITPLLFSLARPFDSLIDDLPRVFAGQTRSMNDIYMAHSVDTPYIRRNYKDALLALEAKGKITASPAKRKIRTFGDTVMATFPAEVS